MMGAILVILARIIALSIVVFALVWPVACFISTMELSTSRDYTGAQKKKDERGITYLLRKSFNIIQSPIIYLRVVSEHNTLRTSFKHKLYWLFGKEVDNGSSTVNAAKNTLQTASSKLSDRCYSCNDRVMRAENSPASSETLVTQCRQCEDNGPERNIIIVEETAGDIGDFTIRRRGYEQKPYGWDILLTEIDEDAIDKARDKIIRLEVAERALSNTDISDKIQNS